MKRYILNESELIELVTTAIYPKVPWYRGQGDLPRGVAREIAKLAIETIRKVEYEIK